MSYIIDNMLHLGGKMANKSKTCRNLNFYYDIVFYIMRHQPVDCNIAKAWEKFCIS